MPRGIYTHKPLSAQHKAKLSVSLKGKNTWSLGNKNAWKGDRVGYHGVHVWIKQILGTPSLCENCGAIEATRFEWANLSGKYIRDTADWARLCVRCHRLIDGNYARWGETPM